ncbi:hypothetical protein IU500_07170 [Nocardia terpenica]|uniref:ParB/Sulfiredoxin domain-containing protein n=1 Tax=Nocardia terpenica TaxID=455432 RepID=A0A161XCK5_9NOCA|nr:DUF6551 family protein [Nocardia terpenica]KZM70958.1 hypothetical protein AWN90_41270 [Nocardia terpenica]MBF6060558.1 hypothetical protein [Nocardia terpenica]MBF6103818.1 hypothetical protein [Nocardia terpenica]MBF6111808.1 hypothetical protein [Nocardia terpenica]MBF6118039.1 hypothetical protein [Nocardia terpenica]
MGRAPARIEVTSRLRWVRLDQMKVNPQAQRVLDRAWADELARDFDPDLMGFIHVSLRDGWYYIVDGQHRRDAAMTFLGSDQQVQCHVYEGLTCAQEAELFLELNRTKRQGPMGRYKVALTAGKPVETDIDRIVRALGLQIGANPALEEIGCVTTLVGVYRKHGPGSLGFALRVIRDTYGYDGFKREPIAALALIKDRYGDGIDEARLASRLARKGLVELRRAAKSMREATGNPADQCYAHTMVAFYNRGTGKRIDPWWNLGAVGGGAS